MDGLYEHPVYDMVGKAWTVDVPFFPACGFYDQMPHLGRMPAVIQIIDALLGILPYQLGIQLALMFRDTIVVTQFSAHDKVRALVLRAVVYRQFSVFERHEIIP